MRVSPSFMQQLGEAIPEPIRPDREKWRIPGSNRRPPPCKGGALPTELIPHASRAEAWSSEDSGGPKWIRTTDLTLIRGAL